MNVDLEKKMAVTKVKMNIFKKIAITIGTISTLTFVSFFVMYIYRNELIDYVVSYNQEDLIKLDCQIANTNDNQRRENYQKDRDTTFKNLTLALELQSRFKKY